MRRNRILPRALVAACLLLAGLAAHAQVFPVEAGPIWNDGDARGKCPTTCDRAGGKVWTGDWRTTRAGRMSTCDCVIPGTSHGDYADGTVAGPAGVLRYEQTDFKGNDLPGGGGPANGFDDCATRCAGAAGCVAFTLNTYTAQCFLKSSAQGRRDSPVAISGVLADRTAAPPGASLAPPGGGACSIASTAKCPGCSVSCPPGRTPVCNNAVEGVTSTCARDATCRCL